MLDSSRPKQQNFEKENVKFFVLRIPFFFVFFFGGGVVFLRLLTRPTWSMTSLNCLVDIILNFMESITVFLPLFLQYLSVLALVLCIGFSCLCWFFYHLKFGLEVFLPYNDLIEASAKFASYSMSCREKILATLKNYLTRGSFLRIFVSGSLAMRTSVCHFLASFLIPWCSMLGKKTLLWCTAFSCLEPHVLLYQKWLFLDMCLLCARIYVPDKKISDHINKHLYVSLNQFHPSIRESIVSANKIFFCS